MVKNKYLPLQHQNKRHFLFVFATTTPEKIEQYNAIARWLKLPMTFMCLKEISDFHSPDEDTGKRLENSEQKFHEIKGPIQLIQGERRYQDILRRICTQLDIPFDLQNIFVLTEDSTISLLLRTWVRLKQSLAPYIPGAILNSAERDQVKYKGSRKTFVGPAAELGPIMSAVTVPAFFSMIENSANDERSANIPLLEQITIILHRLADDLAERKDVLHSKTDMKVVPPAPAGTDRTLVYHTGQHEALHIDQLNRNAAGWFRNFLPTKSARAKMIENLYKRALSSPYAPPKHTDRYLKEAGRLVSHVPFFVRQFAGDKLELSSFKKSSKGFIAPEPSGTASCYDVINLEPNFAKSDAFLLGPIGSKAVCRRWATFQFFSLTVEKPIEARSYRKPIVIANDGSWDSALDLYFQLVNNGMSKDYDRSLYEDPLFSGHQMTGLFDVVNEQPSGRCTNKRLANAADKVLRLRRRDYFSFASNDAHRTLRHPHAQSALPNLDDKFSVGVLTSATSDNKILIDTLDRFGACLARQRWCLIWGAGDRHAMGAVYDSYKRANGSHCEGYSTPSIVISETKRGEIPSGCDYSEICPDIFYRMGRIIERSKALAFFPGGVGTMQELLAALVIRDRAPALMNDKPIIIYNPGLYPNSNECFFDKAIHHLLDPAEAAKLKADLAAFRTTGQLNYRRGGIYMATTQEELEKLTIAVEENWRAQKNIPDPKRTPSANRSTEKVLAAA